MQNLRLKAKKYYKLKCDTSLKSYDQAEFKSGTWKQIFYVLAKVILYFLAKLKNATKSSLY